MLTNKLGGQFLAAVVFLILYGLIMIYSCSWIYSDVYYGNSYQLLIKQLLACAIGIVALWVFSRVDYLVLTEWSEVALLVFLFLTALTLIPAFSSQGRWLDVGPFALQPTEGLKFALLLWTAITIQRKEKKLGDFVEGVLPFFVMLGFISLFTLTQPDFSMTMVYVSLVFFMLFIAGAKLKNLGKVVMGALPLFGGLLVMAPYRFQRLIAFANPLQHSQDEGYQLMQSLMALGSGGVLGRGLGQSAEKFLYLPSAHNDFIFAILGEELGFIGAFILIGLFVYLGTKGFQIALKVEDRTGKL
ncbi:MAG: FtsW/RodA/SpoVE family cell cycle protein, partial [Candidatus Bipolaricaulota bacterium]